jgi:ATP-binding cassette subfamily F protein uup
MDRVVDHLFVFHGEGHVQDFPGNYTQYRLEAKGEKIEAKGERVEAKGEKIKTEQKRRLSFKEKKELEELEKQMPLLEAEKAQLEALLSGSATQADEIAKASERYKEVQEALDEAEMRWLELSEVGE